MSASSSLRVPTRFIAQKTAFRLSLLIMLLSLPTALKAQSATPTLGERATARVVQLTAAIRHADRSRTIDPQSVSDLQLGRLWAILGSAYQDATDFPKAEDAYNRSLHLLARPATRAEYATAIDNLGSLYIVYGRSAEAQHCVEQAGEIRRQLGNPIEIAHSEQRIAEVALMRHKFAEAALHSDAAYKRLVDEKDPIVNYRLAALITSAFAHCSLRDECALGKAHAQEALRLALTEPPLNPLRTAHAHMALGFAQWKTGAIEEAQQNLVEGLHIFDSELGQNNPVRIAAMYEYRQYLNATHRTRKRKELDEQLAILTRELSHQCGDCTVSAYGLTNSLR